MKHWIEIRREESAGFVSKRIAGWLLARHQLLYGNSYQVKCGKFTMIVAPWEIQLMDDNNEEIDIDLEFPHGFISLEQDS